jgi:predicted phosphodiesterase
MNDNVNWNRLGRRAFLKQGTLVLAATSLSSRIVLGADDLRDVVRVGLVTDMHYADKASAGTRYYRQSLEKLETAAEQFQQADLTFAVELGDLIDSVKTVDLDLSYLKTIDGQFSTICQDRHYVLGNHCVETLTKEEFLNAVAQERPYYSFDRGGTHFIVLDSCYRSDGVPYGRNNSQWTDANIPAAELEWLKADLAASDTPVVVFAHQRLDVSNNHGVKNNATVRQILEASGRVQAVFQGHSHQNDLKEIGSIHYCTLVAMVEGEGAENSGYSVLEIKPDGTLILSGFCKQMSRNWNLARTG